MTIEKVVCPVLNKKISPLSTSMSRTEVLVYFDDDAIQPIPTSIMCYMYRGDGKCGVDDQDKCIYTEWKALSEGD